MIGYSSLQPFHSMVRAVAFTAAPVAFMVPLPSSKSQPASALKAPRTRFTVTGPPMGPMIAREVKPWMSRS